MRVLAVPALENLRNRGLLQHHKEHLGSKEIREFHIGVSIKI